MKHFFTALIITSSLAVSFASDSPYTQKYFNGPTVTAVSSSSVLFSLSPIVLGSMTDEEKSRVYFEYIRTNMVCPAIYPTPPAGLPQKTEVGKTEVTVSGLSASTAYSVIYKRDNTIRCITTPCPENGFDSVAVEFTTVGVGTQPIYKGVRRNIRYGERGDDVVTLQKILIEKGYLRTSATGYFGVLTLKAVKDFQRAHGIISTGFVGPLTRKEL